MFSVPFSVLPSNRTNCFGDSPEGAMSIMASGLAYQHFRTVYRESFGSDLPHWVDKPHLFEKMPIVRMAARAGFRLFLAVLIEDELPDASVPPPPGNPMQRSANTSEKEIEHVRRHCPHRPRARLRVRR